MTANLIFALITIAGLGILALVLIFFGGAKKPKQAQYKEKTKPTKTSEEKPAAKPSVSQTSQHKEPFISSDELAEEVIIIRKPTPVVKDEVDPAIASLGFSAIDDLLIEPEPVIHQSKQAKPTPIQTPVEFKPSAKKNTSAQSDIIVLHVMANPDQPFVGYELLQAMTAAGMCFGKMDIFHRFDDNQPQKILFSLCSAVEPGNFDIANIGALACPGLSLFMRISSVDNAKATFNLMLETANQLAEDLAGYVCDEKRQPLTDEKLHKLLHLTNKQKAFV